MKNNIVIIPMGKNHVEAAVSVHLRAFPGFFLSYLGENFLRVFYNCVIEDPTGISFVAINDRELVGFVVGSSCPKGFFKQMIKSRRVNMGNYFSSKSS